jgi:hypothetical protein
MNKPRRATIYFDAEIHRALRLKAATSDSSISDVVNAAVRLSLAEDAIDLAAHKERRDEESLDFEAFVKDLRRRGRL